MSYSPGAEEQHKGELNKARQHGVELLETWLILEYCDCGSLEDATLEGKYVNDLVRSLTIPHHSMQLLCRQAYKHACMQCTKAVEGLFGHALSKSGHGLRACHVVVRAGG